MIATDTDEETVRVSLDFPKSMKERLEQEALAAKQRGETGRVNQSHVVLKALRLYFERGGTE